MIAENTNAHWMGQVGVARCYEGADERVKVYENGNETKPMMADMVELPGKLDKVATSALRHGQQCHLEKCKHAQLIDSRVREDPLQIVRL